MNVKNAKSLLNETFKNSFDMDTYKKFLSETFNTSNIVEKNQINFVKKDFSESEMIEM